MSKWFQICFLEKSLERDTGQRVPCKSLVFLFLFFSTLVGDFFVKSALIVWSQANKNDVTYFRVLRDITSFKRAELQFS